MLAPLPRFAQDTRSRVRRTRPDMRRCRPGERRDARALGHGDARRRPGRAGRGRGSRPWRAAFELRRLCAALDGRGPPRRAAGGRRRGPPAPGAAARARPVLALPWLRVRTGRRAGLLPPRLGVRRRRVRVWRRPVGAARRPLGPGDARRLPDCPGRSRARRRAHAGDQKKPC
ncbi:MAG: hypothetical protein MZW92_70915 [Comamonadaceae bacterium]|nr:hypothetical protein [Comamonadaceae bacterium]